jgi:hypothetical protein
MAGEQTDTGAKGEGKDPIAEKRKSLVRRRRVELFWYNEIAWVLLTVSYPIVCRAIKRIDQLIIVSDYRGCLIFIGTEGSDKNTKKNLKSL